jgi:hypothetical protein
LHCKAKPDGMANDLNDALTQISAIEASSRGRRSSGATGPGTVAATALLAAAPPSRRASSSPSPMQHLVPYLVLWTCTATLCVALVAADMVARTRAVHGEQAHDMLLVALEQFVPAGVAGGLLTLILHTVAPDAAWLLPSIWQLFLALGVFASCRFLPPAMFWVGSWYLVSGLGTLVYARGVHALSPIPMGVGLRRGPAPHRGGAVSASRGDGRRCLSARTAPAASPTKGSTA